MHIKTLCEEAHRIACEKGFWDDAAGRPGQAIRNTSELLMLIVSELGEACEALRNDFRQKERANRFAPITWQKDTFEDEIADTFIRLGDLCEAMGIDIEWQIKKKMEYNEKRPQKHGKQF